VAPGEACQITRAPPNRTASGSQEYGLTPEEGGLARPDPQMMVSITTWTRYRSGGVSTRATFGVILASNRPAEVIVVLGGPW
jgi:hypothetical protein